MLTKDQTVFILSVLHIFVHLICITTPQGRYKACNVTKPPKGDQEVNTWYLYANWPCRARWDPEQKSQTVPSSKRQQSPMVWPLGLIKGSTVLSNLKCYFCRMNQVEINKKGAEEGVLNSCHVPHPTFHQVYEPARSSQTYLTSHDLTSSWVPYPPSWLSTWPKLPLGISSWLKRPRHLPLVPLC